MVENYSIENNITGHRKLESVNLTFDLFLIYVFPMHIFSLKSGVETTVP